MEMCLSSFFSSGDDVSRSSSSRRVWGRGAGLEGVGVMECVNLQLFLFLFFFCGEAQRRGAPRAGTAAPSFAL